MDFTATAVVQLSGISVRPANSIYLKLRRCIAVACEQQYPLQGEVEVMSRTLLLAASGVSVGAATMAKRLCLDC